MWPESTPGSSARNGGSPWLRAASRNRSVRRSLMRGDVGDRDGEEVEHVADRRAVEVAVGLDPAVERDHRVVDGRGQLAAGDARRRGRAVSRAAPCTCGRAAQRVGVLHAGALRARGAMAMIAAAGQQRAQVGGASRPGPGAGAAPAGRRRTRRRCPAAPRRSSRRRRRPCVEQPAQVGERQHQHAEHAVGAVDQRQALLLGQLDRLDAGGAQRLGGGPQRRRRRRARRPRPSARARPCDSGARSPEQPSEPYSCTTGVMPGVEHRGVGLRGRPAARRCGRWPGSTAAAASAPRTTSRSTSGPGAGGVRADQGALQLGAPLERDVRGGQRAEAGGDAVVRLGRPRPAASTTSRLRAISASASSASRTPQPVAGDADDVVRG